MADIQQLLSQGSLRFNLHIKKCTAPQVRTSHEKTKAIQRSKLNRCSFNCLKHQFALNKIAGTKERNKFMIQKHSVTCSFCPYHNEKMRLYEGGTPQFNNDRRIETPAFVIKFQTLSDSESVYKQRFKDVLARATNETLYTSDQKHRIQYDRKCMSKGRHPQFEKSIEDLRQILIKKDERELKNQEK